MNRRVGVGSGEARVVEGVEIATPPHYSFRRMGAKLTREIFGRPKSHSNRHVRPMSAAAASPIGSVRDDRDGGLDLFQDRLFFDEISGRRVGVSAAKSSAYFAWIPPEQHHRLLLI
jgi:hypothetical protein